MLYYRLKIITFQVLPEQFQFSFYNQDFQHSVEMYIHQCYVSILFLLFFYHPVIFLAKQVIKVAPNNFYFLNLQQSIIFYQKFLNSCLILYFQSNSNLAKMSIPRFLVSYILLGVVLILLPISFLEEIVNLGDRFYHFLGH